MHNIVSSSSGVANRNGFTRKGLRCSCGKRLTGWDLGDVIRRMSKHVETANAAVIPDDCPERCTLKGKPHPVLRHDGLVVAVHAVPFASTK